MACRLSRLLTPITIHSHPAGPAVVRRVPRQVVRHGISDPTIDGHTYVAMVDGATGSPTGATMEPLRSDRRRQEGIRCDSGTVPQRYAGTTAVFQHWVNPGKRRPVGARCARRRVRRPACCAGRAASGDSPPRGMGEWSTGVSVCPDPWVVPTGLADFSPQGRWSSTCIAGEHYSCRTTGRSPPPCSGLPASGRTANSSAPSKATGPAACPQPISPKPPRGCAATPGLASPTPDSTPSRSTRSRTTTRCSTPP